MGAPGALNRSKRRFPARAEARVQHWPQWRSVSQLLTGSDSAMSIYGESSTSDATGGGGGFSEGLTAPGGGRKAGAPVALNEGRAVITPHPTESFEQE